ncbi:MAG: methyltransferase domain-containing protein [Anaerolineae bacterium]|nr:methyltransferase domain-containing protein [Anaerolineae bacterium]
MTKPLFPFFEAEVLPGLERLALDDIRARVGQANTQATVGAGAVVFTYAGPLQRLQTLRVATAVYGSLTFNVPRPKALLGHEHFTRILATCKQVLQPDPTGFQSVGLDAAGSETTVMQRIVLDLARDLQLEAADDRGDLNLRIRRPRSGVGWEVLFRLTPRPLATRAWRVVNYKGALFAPIAHAMNQLAQPTPDDHVLNLCVGSGTLLIERVALLRAGRLVGCDSSDEALSAARQNLAAAAVEAELLPDDVQNLSLPPATFDVILADLPFGNLVGSHADNLTLYPAVLKSAERVARPAARMVLITHEKRLLARALSEQSAWRLDKTLAVNQNGLHPDIFVLTRAD